MSMDFTPEQVGTALVALGLVLKGVMNELNKRKEPTRGCLMGDDSHDELKDLLKELIARENKSQAWHAKMHDTALEMLLILRRK